MNVIQFTASNRAQAAIAKASEKDPLNVAFVNATDEKPAELLIYDEIGNDPAGGYFGTGSKDVGQFLRANKGRPIHVRINSPGGLVWDGLTIHNSLKMHDGQVTVTIEGVAASAASLISLAGRPTRMFENATYMIHKVQLGGYGNADVMRELADIGDKLDDGLALSYQAKTKLPKATILKMMAGKIDGTWLTAKEAKAQGFIDEIVRLNDKATAMTDAQIRQAKREDARREFLNSAK